MPTKFHEFNVFFLCADGRTYIGMSTTTRESNHLLLQTTKTKKLLNKKKNCVKFLRNNNTQIIGVLKNQGRGQGKERKNSMKRENERVKRISTKKKHRKNK